jgi:hypothetical protein
LSTIQRISWYVREHETDFIQKVREASTVQQEETVKDSKRQLIQAKKRFAELDALVKKLSESNATGKLSDRHFERLMGEYDSEQSALEITMRELQDKIDTWDEDNLKTDRFIELVKRYTDFSELTTPMLNEFIERVTVYEGDGRGSNRRVRVDIHLNFIGAFAVHAESKSHLRKRIRSWFSVEKVSVVRDVMLFLSVAAMVATIIFLCTSTPQQIGWTIFIRLPPLKKRNSGIDCRPSV